MATSSIATNTAPTSQRASAGLHVIAAIARIAVSVRLARTIV
jgi:hypothetical protein